MAPPRYIAEVACEVVVSEEELAKWVEATANLRTSDRLTVTEEEMAAWEATAGTKYPRVGQGRKNPVHPQFLLRPWLLPWWKAGGDHRVLGVTHEGLEHFFRSELELWKDEARGVERGRIYRSKGEAWITELCGSVKENGSWGAGKIYEWYLRPW